MKTQIPQEILLVEDDILSRFLTEQIILRTYPNACIRFFEDGKKFMDYYYQAEAKDSLVLLDLNMPYINGFECLDEMTKKHPNNCPVMILTSSISNLDKQKAKTYPMVVDYLEKPFSFHSAKKISKYTHQVEN